MKKTLLYLAMALMPCISVFAQEEGEGEAQVPPPIYAKSFQSLLADAKSLVVDTHYATGQSALQNAITKAESDFAEIKYVEDPDAELKEEIATLNGQVIEVMTELQTAIDEFVFGNDHVDATEKIQNPSFSVDGNNSKTVTSWEVTNFKQNRRDAATYTSTRKDEQGTAYTVHYFVEQWSNSSQGNLGGSGDIHQVITGLPAGHYRLTADCLAHNQKYTADCEEAVGVELYANDAVREIGLTGFNDNTAIAFSVDFDIVAGQDATIGFRYTNTNVNWVGWDNVTLLFIGDPNQENVNPSNWSEGQDVTAELGLGDCDGSFSGEWENKTFQYGRYEISDLGNYWKGDVAPNEYVPNEGNGGVITFYAKPNFDIYQVVKIPAGSYTIKVQSFYREGNPNDTFTNYNMGNVKENAHVYASVLANQNPESEVIEEFSTAIRSMATSEQETLLYDAIDWMKDGNNKITNAEGEKVTIYYPSCTPAIVLYFAEGRYWNSFDITLSEDSYVRLGLRKVASIAEDWLPFSNFQVIYNGKAESCSPKTNTLAISDTKVCKGTSVVLPISMNNIESITAFEFDLYLPEGITLTGCELTDRKGRDHTSSFSVQSEGKYKVVAYSASSKAFSGTEGAVVNLMLDVSEDMAVGEYMVNIKNIELTLSDATPITPADISAKLTVSDIKAGDVNGSGKVTISDVVAIVNHVIGRTPANFVAAAADVNGDGIINVFDVTKTVNIILGIDGEEAKMRDAVDTIDGMMTMEREGDGMNLTVEMPANYIAMQFDVIVPEGSSLQDVKLNGCADHALAFDRTGENRYTVIAYSLSNAAFEATEDALVTLQLSDSKSASIENAVFITTDGRCVGMDVADLSTGIQSVDSSKLTVDSDAIYNLAGQRVTMDRKALPKGVYIKNGRKFVVK